MLSDKIKNIIQNKSDENPLKQEIQNSPGFGALDASKKYRNKLATRYTKYKNLFVSKVVTWVNIPDEHHICALIAWESYKDLEKRSKDIDKYSLDEKNSNKTCCIYVDNEVKQCIIWYRWTVVTDIKDIISDTQIVLDIQWIDLRVKDALEIYDKIREEYQWYKIWVCGHSLGGTISYIVAKHRDPDRCVVFNPWVSLNTFFAQMLQDTIRRISWTEKTYTYKIFGDVISTVGFVWHTKVFVIPATDPLKLHAMENFL